MYCRIYLLLPHKVFHHAGEFHREDIFRGRTRADGFEGFKILKRHGLLIDRLGGIEDRIQRLRETLCAQ